MGGRVNLPVFAYLAGLALLAVGVAMIYVPAGVIVAGITSAASAVLYVRGGGERR
jgi:hypothetical protein